MELKTLKPSELSWNFDFAPRSLWPTFMPVICISIENRLEALTGFDQKSKEILTVLILNADPLELIPALYQKLAPFEELRLLSKLGTLHSYHSLLTLPKTMQDYCDERNVSLKTLKPLTHLSEWCPEIGNLFLTVKPSASQIREIVDLLCDLKSQGKTWSECSATERDPNKWIVTLRKMRFPRSTNSDNHASTAIENLPWPRGVQAKWERQGDQACVSIHAKIASPREWQILKDNFQKLNMVDSLWKT